MNQLYLFDSASPRSDDVARPEIASLLGLLPPLPPVIRYYDEFDDITRSIASPASADSIKVHAYGRSTEYKFDHLSPDCGILVKHAFLFILGQGRHVATARKAFDGARLLDSLDVERVVAAGPYDI
jgi:hypothetical protein